MPDETYYKNQVKTDCGDIGQSAVHEIVFPVEASGGTWNINFSGSLVQNIAYPNLPGTVQGALENSSVLANNVVVTLGQRGFILSYRNALANQDIPLPTVDGSNLIASDGSFQSIPVRQNTTGKANHWTQARIDEMWARRDGISNLELRFQYVKLDAILELQGIVWTQVNEQTGDQKRDFQTQFSNLKTMEGSIRAEIQDLAYGEESDLAASAGQSYYGTPAVRVLTQARYDARFPRSRF